LGAWELGSLVLWIVETEMELKLELKLKTLGSMQAKCRHCYPKLKHICSVD
jgi:hypothetical protein